MGGEEGSPLSDSTSDRAPAGSGEAEATPWVPARERFFLRPELFLYPSILVLACVLVVLCFAAAAQEGASVEKLIDELKAEGILNPKRPSRAAYDLAQRSQEMEAAGRKLDEAATKKLIEVFRSSRANPAIHQYVVLALGRAGEESLVVPVLEEVLKDPQSDDGVRVDAIRGLGLSRSPRAVELLLLEIERVQADEHWEIRKNILHNLTVLAGPRPAPGEPPAAGDAGGAGRREEIARALRRHAQDPNPRVAWDASLWLAERFEDPAGVETLRKLIDWKHLEGLRLGQQEGLSPRDQEMLLSRAIGALAILRDEESLGAIRRHAADNRNYKVKGAAIRALRGWVQDPSAPAGTPVPAAKRRETT